MLQLIPTARGLPFDDTETVLDVFSAQEAIEDALMLNRNYFPVRERAYTIREGYQLKVYHCLTLDGNMVLEGMGVVF